MKAMVQSKYGSPDVLHLEEIDKPIPKDNEILVKIHAASLNAYDWHMMRGKPYIMRLMGLGIFTPKNKMLGADIAGQVEAVGRDITLFKAGDDVYGDLASLGGGGNAEYVCATEKTIAMKPGNLSYEEAAAVPMAALTALQSLRDKGEIRAGQKVLINGASGGVGTFAVQIAKSYGAEVTAVCSARNVDQARSIGADHVIDYRQEDFTQNGQRYDLIFAANGNRPIFDYKRSLNPQGIYVCAGGSMKQLFQAMLLGPFMSRGKGKKMRVCSTHIRAEDLDFMTALLDSGKVVPVIDRRYPLSDVADAMRYLEEGHAQGKIVIAVA